MVNGKLDEKSISGLPSTTYQQTTGGYFDIALDPKYKTTGWVYLAYSHTNENPADKNAASMTKVVRGKIKDHQWVEQQTLFEVPDSLKVTGGNRWGGRLFFDKEGFLFFSIGDMARANDSQDLSKPSGKVYQNLSGWYNSQGQSLCQESECTSCNLFHWKSKCAGVFSTPGYGRDLDDGTWSDGRR